MTKDALLARARSAAGQSIVYKLGGGGMLRSSPLPSDANHACDCSGFVLLGAGHEPSDYDPLYVKFNSGWINTDTGRAWAAQDGDWCGTRSS